MPVARMVGFQVNLQYTNKLLVVNNYNTGCDWVFKAMKGSSADYHQEMNAVNFEKWFEDKLLPALPANSLVVMDNASYHRYVMYSS